MKIRFFCTNVSEIIVACEPISSTDFWIPTFILNLRRTTAVGNKTITLFTFFVLEIKETKLLDDSAAFVDNWWSPSGFIVSTSFTGLVLSRCSSEWWLPLHFWYFEDLHSLTQWPERRQFTHKFFDFTVANRCDGDLAEIHYNDFCSAPMNKLNILLFVLRNDFFSN